MCVGLCSSNTNIGLRLLLHPSSQVFTYNGQARKYVPGSVTINENLVFKKSVKGVVPQVRY